MYRFLMVALLLASCTLTGPKPKDVVPPGGDAPMAGIAAGDAIEVTPLDAASPGAAPSDAKPADAAPVPSEPIQTATDATPHPKARPGGASQADAAEPAQSGEVQPDAAPVEQKSEPQMICEAADGVWGQTTSGAYLCQKRTRDAGKTCHKKGDCSGECLAPSNTCAPVTPLFGCNDVLDKQGRVVTLCLD